jgi:lipopolysaccharide export system permease protein
MWILDRHIASRYLANVVLLFALLFLFAVAIDVIVGLDEFSAAARADALRAVGVDPADEASRGVDPPTFRYWISLVHAVIDFQGPRIAQFYAYMLGLVSVGAAGFTLAQMVRSRELVAILATGTSLVRVGMVFIVVATGLNLLQLANQEVLLPRLAPLLVRGQGEILEGGLREFPVRLTRDGRGQLLWGKALDPHEERITGFLLIERDGQGAAIARTSASSATWDADRIGWRLEGGERSSSRIVGEDGGVVNEGETRVIDFAATDLSPRALTIRQYGQYAQMLSLDQLRQMREEGGVAPDLISRLTYLRLGSMLVNLLVLVAALPFFLLREPANLLRQSILCAAFTVPGALGSLVAMTAELPGLSPAVSVFLPAAILLPVALGRFGAMRT